LCATPPDAAQSAAAGWRKNRPARRESHESNIKSSSAAGAMRWAARGATAGWQVIVWEDRAVGTESPTVTAEAAFTADAVNELMDFVAHDPQFARLGLRGAITLVLGRRLGAAPSEETVSLMAQAFWDAWEDRFCEFERSPPRSPR
jgi:hypothetical protein